MDTAPNRPKRVVPVPNDEEFLVGLATLCEILSLPVKWVRRQARAGNLPCLRIGGRLVFDVETVWQCLHEAARTGTPLGS